MPNVEEYADRVLESLHLRLEDFPIPREALIQEICAWQHWQNEVTLRKIHYFETHPEAADKLPEAGTITDHWTPEEENQNLEVLYVSLISWLRRAGYNAEIPDWLLVAPL